MPPEIDGTYGVRMHTHIFADALRAILPVEGQPSLDLGSFVLGIDTQLPPPGDALAGVDV
jgi:hypothetical protein